MSHGNAGPDWFFDLSKFVSDLRAPAFGIEAVVAMQRKNLEALTQAQQVAIEGVQAVLRYQLELARRTMEEFSSAFSGLLQPNGSMEDRMAKHADFSKSALEKGLSNAREITDLVTKANAEAINVLTRRVTESFDEIRDLASSRHVSA